MYPSQDTVVAMQADAQKEVDALKSLSDQMVLDLKAEHDKGFDEGIAQTTTPGDKIYSEEELQAELAPLRTQISELKNQVDMLPVLVKEASDKAAAALQAQIVADFEGTQVDDAAFLAKYKVGTAT